MAVRDTIQRSWWGRILAEHDTEPVELIGGGTKVLMGLWLLLPWQTFAMSDSYDSIRIIPEWIWGTFLLTVGLLHIAALHSGHRTWRKWAALVGFLIWSCFGLVLGWANPAAIGWMLFLSVGASLMWASIRLGMPS
jgi:hypothetical protein